MTQTAHNLENLGKCGLLERLDEKTKNRGVSNYLVLIDFVRNKSYERIQGIGDYFFPEIDLYNSVGAIYPLLNREQRDEAIKTHLNQFDMLNYLAVNTNHTPRIREPLLLADIIFARPLYWPGLRDEERLWKKRTSFAK